MNTQETSFSAVIGVPMEGGFYAGQIRIEGVPYALIVAPKVPGEHEDTVWLELEQRLAGADSYCDGAANTAAMAEAGSALAQWARDLQIGGYGDWYIPSQDELEILYRAFKPTAENNSLYGRSGMNLSAAPPTHAYTRDFPAQTTAAAFTEGGAEAFTDTWYWSSTQHAANDNYAWCQSVDDGYQSLDIQSASLRARAVRRFPI